MTEAAELTRERLYDVLELNEEERAWCEASHELRLLHDERFRIFREQLVALAQETIDGLVSNAEKWGDEQ